MCNNVVEWTTSYSIFSNIYKNVFRILKIISFIVEIYEKEIFNREIIQNHVGINENRNNCMSKLERNL